MIAHPEQPPPMDSAYVGAELTRPDVLAGPYPLLHWMRREAPVHNSRALRGWIITR